MKPLLVLMLAAAFVASVGSSPQAQSAADGEKRLAAAQLKATFDGDLRGAIADYQKLADGKDRRIAAKALLGMAECYRKLFDAQGEQRAYERIVQRFPDQPEAVAEARKRLPVNASLSASPPVSERQVLVASNRLVFNSLTPDGRFMAMAGDSTTGLHVRDMVSGVVTPIAEKPHPSFFPIFSPSQKQLVYIDGGDDDRAICVIANRTGATPKPLMHLNDENIDFWPRGWAHDEQSVLVELQKADKTWQLAWLSVTDGHVRPLRSLEWRRPGGPERRVSFSPDGRFIAYSALAHNPAGPDLGPNDSKDRHIYVLALDGTKETEITMTSGVDETPVWTTDGSHILFVSDRAGSVDLWAVPVKDGNPAGQPVDLKVGIGPIVPLGITRTGTFYYTPAGSPSNVPMVIAEVSDRFQIGPTVGRPVMAAINSSSAVSPDGTMLAVLRNRTPFVMTPNGPAPIEKSLPDVVFHTFATGVEQSVLLPGHGNASIVRWSRDGKTVIVGIANYPTGDLLPADGVKRFGNPPFNFKERVDAHTGKVTQLAAFGLPFLFSDLSLDDRVAFGIEVFSADGAPIVSAETDESSLDHSCIATFDLGSGQQRQIFCLPAGQIATGLLLSPDGRSLAFFVRQRGSQKPFFQEAPAIACLNTDGSGYRVIARGVGGTGDQLMWGQDGQALFFPQGTAKSMRLMTLPISNRSPEFTGAEFPASARLTPRSNGGFWMQSRAEQPQNEVRAIENVTAALKNGQ